MSSQNIQIEDLIGKKNISISRNKILQLIQGKIIFVTGGAGSIGSEIIHQLGKYNPKKFVVIDQAETPLHDLTLKVEKEFDKLDFEFIICDIRNKQRLKSLFKKFNPDLVYHCAAYKHVPLMERNPTEAVLVNIMGTKFLADLAIKYNTERFILISSDKAVNPSSVMGATKRVSELYLQSLQNDIENTKTKFVITRFGNVLGSNGSVVPLFKKQIEQGGPLTITHKEVERYFMTITEACKLVLEASSMALGGEVYFFDMGKTIKILDLAKRMIFLAGLIPEEDIKIKIIGLRLGEKLKEVLLNDKSRSLNTCNEKILLIEEKNLDFKNINREVKKIIKLVKKYEVIKIVKKIKNLVPEYKSMNSPFEKLDT